MSKFSLTNGPPACIRQVEERRGGVAQHVTEQRHEYGYDVTGRRHRAEDAAAEDDARERHQRHESRHRPEQRYLFSFFFFLLIKTQFVFAN